MTLKDTSMIKGVSSMVGTPILIMNNTLRLSGRPIYLKTDLKNGEQLREQIRHAERGGIR